ncbi:MAG: glycosyltransferase family 2 protein [Frankia sp.]|nr:glycosyltransferase family 2 protein [Frankia sp.]
MASAATTVLNSLGVVIVTYRSAADIADCLGQLPVTELAGVVVVDNDSWDTTRDVVRSLDLPGVTLLHRTNRGFGAGCNVGLAALPTTASLVLFLNPDARIQRADLRRLAEYVAARDDCAMAGPRMTRRGRAHYSAGRQPSLATELHPLLPRALGALLPERRYDPDFATSGPVGYVEGACMLARRDAITAVGGFDETYFLCFEEMDLARRLVAAGWSVHLCAEATAEHAGGSSREHIPQSGADHQVRSQVFYLRKWRGAAAGRVFTRVALLAWWLRRRVGKLDEQRYRAIRSGLRTPLRGGSVTPTGGEP